MTALLVEIVGAAGAGKTTLLSTLRASGQPIEAVFSFRQLVYAPYFTKAIIETLPFLVRQWVNGQSHSRKVMLWLIRLSATYQILQRQIQQPGQRIIVLDQGPIYMLMRLVEYGATQGSNEALDRWWHQSLVAWAKLLDLVILLDADENVLVQRVFERSKDHFAKDKPEAEAKEIILRHRRLYRQVVDQLTDSGKTRLLYFDTGSYSVDQLLEKTVLRFVQLSAETNMKPSTLR